MVRELQLTNQTLVACRCLQRERGGRMVLSTDDNFDSNAFILRLVPTGSELPLRLGTLSTTTVKSVFAM